MGKLVLFLAFMVLMPICLAQTLESNSYDFKILYGKVLVENELVFDKTTDVDFTISIPEDASALSLYINEDLEEPTITDNKISLNYNSVNKIKLSYITKELLGKSTFLVNLKNPFDTKELNVKLTLPEGAVLDKPLKDSLAGSIYPKPDKAETDGKSLIFSWQKVLDKDGELSIFVVYKEKTKIVFLTWVLLVIVLALILFILLRKTKTKIVVRKEKAIEKHLKEDEEQVVNLLKRRSGKCEQGTLRVITGFSKASLSRLLKELEERKIIYKEKRGKKNLVFLRK